MMRVVTIVLSLQLVAALQVKSRSSMLQAVENQMENTNGAEANDTPTCVGCNYGYVTMFIDKEKMAAARPDMFVHRTPEEKIEVKGGEAHGILVDTQEPELSAVEDNEKANIAGFTNYLNDKDAILELSRNLKSVGAMYPLVVLTNDPAFKGTLDDKSGSEEYGVIETVLISDYLVPSCTMREATIAHFQKFAVFDMLKFDKLLYIEPNIRMRNKNLDGLFTDKSLNTDKFEYFMRDSWSCDPEEQKISMSAMLFKPSRKVFNLLFAHMGTFGAGMKDCGSPEAIMELLREPGHSFMKMDYLPPRTISYQHCDQKENDLEAHDMIQYGATVKTVLKPASFRATEATEETLEQPNNDM